MSQPYTSIPVSEEEASQAARLIYILSHGVKEHLVEKVEDWPGAHCAIPLRDGTSAEGVWFNRTLEFNARLRRDLPSVHVENSHLGFQSIRSGRGTGAQEGPKE